MKFITIILKQNSTDFLRALLLLVFSFFICYYFGFKGIIPLDDFINLNSGYRVYNGDLPFKDYYEVTGPVLSISQSIFFKLFGLSWKSFVIHSSVINSLTSIMVYIYFLSQSKNKNLSFGIAILFSFLFYPNNGVPGVDHHAWALAIISLLLFNMGFDKKNYNFIFFSIFTLFLSFLVKQVPSVYVLICMLVLYISQSIFERRVVYFNKIFLTISILTITIFILLKQNNISLYQFFQQYFLMLINFGSERIIKVDIYLIKQNLSQIYFLFFLIFPTLFLIFKKKDSDFLEKKLFFIIIFLIVMSLFYEIHTNNQAMTFALIPIVSGFIYEIQKNYKKEVFLKNIYIFFIFICFIKIIQIDIKYLSILTIFLVINFFFIKRVRLNLNANYLLIMYLIVTSFYYFELNIKSRKYKDISFEKNIISFDAFKIDRFFKNLNWKMNSELSSDDFINKKKKIVSLLKSIDKNYIFITDYQFYNIILQKKDFSPVKYWATEISYPSKENKLRKNFEDFFLKKLIENDVEYIILDQNISLFEENLFDYNFLLKCFENKITNKDLKLEIFKFKFNCFQN